MLPLHRQHRLLSSHTRILAHLSPSVPRTILRHDLRRAASTSTASLDPVIRGFASELGEKQPCFAMPARNVQILSEPQVFYDSLLNMIRHAKKRIFISSLYIGEDEHELADTLRNALASNESLTLDMHLDLNRSTRPGPNSPVNLLLPLLQQFPERVQVHLFRSPALRGLMARVVPPRFNEGWGTWHAKIYGADNDVLISGANLNKSYFTNRQDRYIRFNSQPQLAEYCRDYLRSASTFSYRLSAQSAGGYDLHWSNELHPHHFHAKAKSSLNALQASYRDKSPAISDSSDDVLVYPVIQAGQFEVREEVDCLASLFRHIATQSAHKSPGPLIDLTSGYFGLSDQYRRLVIDSDVDCRIVAASPMANGFYGSRGISGRIPEGYTLLEQRFMRSVVAAGRSWDESTSQQKGIELREWAREGWTYHSKGIWLSPTPDQKPVFTLVGSTNLAARSAELDVELSFGVLTHSDALRSSLLDEVTGLRKYAVPWRGAEREVSFGTKVLVGMVGGML